MIHVWVPNLLSMDRLGWLQLKSQITTNVSKDVEKSEPSCIIGGNVKWSSYSGKQMIKYRVNPNSSTRWYIPKRNLKKKNAHKEIYTQYL